MQYYGPSLQLVEKVWYPSIVFQATTNNTKHKSAKLADVSISPAITTNRVLPKQMVLYVYLHDDTKYLAW